MSDVSGKSETTGAEDHGEHKDEPGRDEESEREAGRTDGTADARMSTGIAPEREEPIDDESPHLQSP
ncbi:MAG: hypothetical protein QOJ09_2856 [Actinomycetota bacterium]|jgi:hypothetical protein|nr:hypothetical protein [Actinomycetota bacterium]